MSQGPTPLEAASERYLALIDISGFTSFLAGVERTHGVDFSAGIPAGYGVIRELLDGVVQGIQPEFELVKLEGDAVFGAAPAASLDGHGGQVVEQLASLYRTFGERRDAARSATDDRCTACTAVSGLDLKMILHRGIAVRQAVGGFTDLLGPAVNVAHRLLKNTVRGRIGARPYLLVTQTAADGLGQPDHGLAHRETYDDVGTVDVRIIDLMHAAGLASDAVASELTQTGSWPEISYPSKSQPPRAAG